MTTALITGAAGFVARHLPAPLRAHGITRVAGADLRPAPETAFDAWYPIDLTDAAAVQRLVAAERPAMVFHLAGHIRGSDKQIASSNVDSARAVLEAVSAEAPGAHVVLVGSAAEYGAVPPADQPVEESCAGNPVGPYGKAKQLVSAMATAYALDRGLHVSVARPSNVIGPGISDTLVVGAIVHRLRSALAGPPPRSIAIGATSAVRDFVAVEDVADGLVSVAECGRAGEAYNLCRGEGHTVAEVLARLIALSPEPIAVRRDPDLIRPGEVGALVCSREKALRELGWRPSISLNESLRSAWEYSAAPQSAS